MRKFPTYRQLDTMDCGEGVSLLGISDAAEPLW